MSKKPTTEFWITNISKMVITIGDLNLSIKPKQSINLFKQIFDKQEIKTSLLSGDLLKRKKMFVFGKTQPQKIQASPILLAEAGASTCNYAYEEIKTGNMIMDDYQNLSDDKFVNELLELEDEDIKSKTKQKRK